MPCKALTMTLGSIPNISADIIEVLIDTEAGAPSSSKYNVRSVPTLIALDRNGCIINSLIGNVQKTKLESWLKSVGAVL